MFREPAGGLWLEGVEGESEQMGSQAFSPLGKSVSTEFLLILSFQARVMDLLAQFSKTVICIALYFHFFTVTHAHYRKLKK